MKMRLPVVLLIVVTISKILSRFFPSVEVQGTQAKLPYKGYIKVLVACRTGGSWYDTVMHVLSQATAPLALKICVMVECKTIHDVIPEDAVDTTLRNIVTLVHVKQRESRCPIAILRRMVRKCVHGDETIVVSLDERIKLCGGWDVIVMKLMHDMSYEAVLSMPHASKSGVPRFPTRTKNTNGVTFRGLDRKFSTPPRMDVVESVCLCTEFCVFPPKALKETTEWSPSPVAQTLHLASLGYRCMTSAFPLFEHDRTLYADVVKHDMGCVHAPLHKNERIGLTREAGDHEKIAKFGSCRAARLTLQFL